MRIVPAVAGVLICLASTPYAVAQTAIGGESRHVVNAPQNTQDDPPFHFRNSGMKVIVSRGHDLAVQPGQNALKMPRTMNCESRKGCEITIALMINISETTGAPYQICGLVDGMPAKPTCFDQPTFAASNLQSLEVPQGAHTVQAQFLDQGNAGTIGEFQGIYTLYEKTGP